MTKEILKRKFIFKKNNKEVVLADPDTDMTPDEVLSFYMGQYPELVTASVGVPEFKDDTCTYTFKTVTGTKG